MFQKGIVDYVEITLGISCEQNCFVERNKTIILWSTWKTDTKNFIKTKLPRYFNGELFKWNTYDTLEKMTALV